MFTAETVIWPLNSQLCETEGSSAFMNQYLNNFVMNVVSFILCMHKVRISITHLYVVIPTQAPNKHCYTADIRQSSDIELFAGNAAYSLFKKESTTYKSRQILSTVTG
jgi:hypothetical protein